MTIQSDLNERIERLARIAIFKDISTDRGAMETVAALFRTVGHPAGFRVLVEGTEGDDLFVIKSGTVEIEKRTRQGDSYTVVKLSADQNAFFGEMALLDNDKRSATVVCATACEFYTLSRDDFLKLGDSHPSIGLTITRQLSRIVCQRLRKANTDIITLFDALVGELAESEGLV
jgi:CRP/FNR family transcriptional regulator, cyclic AMP receptor protein